MEGGSSEPPKSFKSFVYQWLENALDIGITEEAFWNMTPAELERLSESKRRMEKLRLQEKANFDYILADLIGRSIARLHSSANKMPEINEVYPSLFNSQEIEEKKAEKRAELSALRFKLFADAHNKKFNKEAAKD